MTTALIPAFAKILKLHHSTQPTGLLSVVAILARQMRGLSALIAAVIGAADSWSTIYVGTDMPDDEIKTAAAREPARLTISILSQPPAHAL